MGVLKVTFNIPQIADPGQSQRADDLRDLLDAVLEAHAGSALENNCVSSAAVQNCNTGNPGTLNGIASAILSLGSVHAPVREARMVWKMDGDVIYRMLKDGVTVPGFGNGFFPGGDPKWFPVRDILRAKFRAVYDRLGDRYLTMSQKSDTLWPNAAMYTAILCELLNVPDGQESLIVIMARMPAWFEL